MVACSDDDDDDDDGPSGASSTGTPGGPSASGEPRQGGTWRSHTASAAGLPSALDIHRTNDPNVGQGLWQWVANLLLRYDPQDDVVEPDLAAALPEIPDDGQTYIFKINPAAKWQNRNPANGRAVDSEDVKFTFERIKDASTGSPRGGNYRDVDAIETPDAETVIFRLARPRADFPAIVADQYDMILPKELAGQQDPITGAETVIGSGPYELERYASDQGWTLRRRADGYWKPGAAYLDGWELLRLDDPEAARAAFRQGQAHIVTIPWDQRDSFRDDGYQVFEHLATSRLVLWLNHMKEPYSDPRVRKAVSLAIDRRQFLDLANAGAGVPSGPMAASARNWALSESDLKGYLDYGDDRDAAMREAKALLEQAGYADGFSDVIMTVGLFQAATDVIIAMLKQLNIDLSVEAIGTDLVQWQSRLREHNFNVSFAGHTSGPYPDAQLNLYHQTFADGGTRNYADLSDPELDAMLLKQSGTIDAEERQSLVQDIQRYIIENPGGVWIATAQSSFAAQPEVRGLRSSATGANWPVYTAEEAWLDE